MARINFNATIVEPLGEFEPLPAGEYTVLITASEFKETKKKDGEYLQFTYKVVDEGEHKGAPVFDRLNLKNVNQTAVDIARKRLSAICRAVGVLTPNDSEELHNRLMIIRVTVKPGTDEYGSSNEIKAYSAVGLPSQAKATPEPEKEEEVEEEEEPQPNMGEPAEEAQELEPPKKVAKVKPTTPTKAKKAMPWD
jgi:hypothetical protein